MTIGESGDKRSLPIGVLPDTYDRLEQRAAAVDQTVDQYVFDLVVQDAYARSSFEHLRDALLGWCSGLALGLLAVGYFVHADAVLPAAPYSSLSGGSRRCLNASAGASVPMDETNPPAREAVADAVQGTAHRRPARERRRDERAWTRYGAEGQ